MRPTVHLGAESVASSAGPCKGKCPVLLDLVQCSITGMTGEIKPLGLGNGEKVTLNPCNINLPLWQNRRILLR